ncbi:hypothetical protein E1J29_11795 [Xanthomonas hortorum pv. vitians]|nr:hypothetical protein [Xanthomonas hortorum pv. vitians]QEW15037.1 hypothetical protein DYQ48_08570 [Xanthomonas hortorum]NMI27005.1 hypothetical protein [Xanthomonas hortorum pv. vitians]NMI32317.1 hypothetical protein [Xanthomonas hortorum pv. vitians]NMI35692.1 hypothetical protein [Xanthomonas hortorum pv. vitians]
MVGQRRGQNGHGRILAVRSAARRAAAILGACLALWAADADDGPDCERGAGAVSDLCVQVVAGDASRARAMHSALLACSSRLGAGRRCIRQA